MKYLSIALATLLLASCSTTGSSGDSMGTGYGESSQPYSNRTLSPNDIYYGG